MKQLSLIPNPNLSCGGALTNTRQTARVLSSKRPMHMTLKSRSNRNLFKHRLRLKSMVGGYANRFGIRIYASSIQRDHVHLVMKMPNRESYIRFVRTLTGLLARILGKGLWLYRPFTRVASWGRDFRELLNYLFRNDMEIFGIWRYNRPRLKHPAPVHDEVIASDQSLAEINFRVFQ